MSLLSPERYRLGLGASYAVLAEMRGGMLTHWHMQHWTEAAAPSWQASLAAAGAWLHALGPDGGRVGVVLSAELAPLQLLPWRDDAVTMEQQKLLAQARMRQIMGEPAARFKTEVQPTGYGQPWLASAIDEQLLAALTEQIQSAGARLGGVAPLPLQLFNAARKRVNTEAGWLVVAEPLMATAMHWRDGHWQLVQNLPVAALQEEPLQHLLQRETRLAGLPDRPSRCHMFGAPSLRLPDCEALDPGWKRHAGIAQDSPCHLLGGRA